MAVPTGLAFRYWSPGNRSRGSTIVPDLLFARTSDEKAGKNRLHLDLRPENQADPVARLEQLGAHPLDVGQGPDVSWVVMADPDGSPPSYVPAAWAL
jgi:hypothetical protein